MWTPTHVQVTVHKARALIKKGKTGTNDAFVTIALGKEKFQTSVKEKSDDVEWHEKCELTIPKQGNKAEIILTALHHNRMAIDEFLGRVSIPLCELDVYERPKPKWYILKDKPGKEKNKERGELEVKIGFIVKAGSLSDLSKKDKHKSSLGQLSQAAQSFGGSLISIGSFDKNKGLKKLATKIGRIKSSSRNKDDISPKFIRQRSPQTVGDADPGVISEVESDDDFVFEDLSHKGSGCSINSSSKTRSIENVDTNNDCSPTVKPPRIIINSNTASRTGELEKKIKRETVGNKERNTLERIIIGKETTRPSSPVSGLPPEIIKQYSGKSREDLIQIILDLQSRLQKELVKQKDLEDYLDHLLLKVMETTPRILQNPYTRKNKI